MFITDHHVHTNFSGDCNTSCENLIKKSVELGLKEIMFTDHLDYDYPDKKVSFEINYESYTKHIRNLKKQFTEVEILMGIEIGYQPQLNERIDKLLKKYPFDFVICSIHAWDGITIDSGILFRGKTQKEGYRKYFEYLKYCVENFDNCDVFGHLDFIVRYGDFDKKVIIYQDYKNIIDDILKTIIKKGKGIELNTSGLRYNLDFMHPNPEILQRYFELGGKIITLGSDAHTTRDLCADFDKAINLLKKIGFREITTFKNRKPKFIKI